MEDKESETFAKTQHGNSYISIKVGSKKGSGDTTLKFKYLNGRKGKLYQSEQMPIDILYVPADKNSLRTEINLPFCGKNGDRNTEFAKSICLK